MRSSLLVIFVYSLSACRSPATCESAAACLVGDRQGRCMAAPSGSGFCAFGDSACASSLRWHATAGDGLADLCVAVSKNAVDSSRLADASSQGDSEAPTDGSSPEIDAGATSDLGTRDLHTPAADHLTRDMTLAARDHAAPGDLSARADQYSGDLLRPAPDHCEDGVKNSDETDTDCGGTTCRRCGLGQSCVFGLDCEQGCLAGRCVAPASADPSDPQRPTCWPFIARTIAGTTAKILRFYGDAQVLKTYYIVDNSHPVDVLSPPGACSMVVEPLSSPPPAGLAILSFPSPPGGTPTTAWCFIGYEPAYGSAHDGRCL